METGVTTEETFFSTSVETGQGIGRWDCLFDPFQYVHARKNVTWRDRRAVNSSF